MNKTIRKSVGSGNTRGDVGAPLSPALPSSAPAPPLPSLPPTPPSEAEFETGAEPPRDGTAVSPRTQSAGAMLDRYDVAILTELQRDARLSNTELASRIGLSAAPTWRRVKRLEVDGYITGYHATLDRRRLGLGVLAFVRVDAERNTGATTRELEDAIRQLPEVMSCHYISGAGTFELQVLVTDLEAFSTFSIKTLLNLPNVKDIHTSFSLGEVKASGGVPLGHLG
ncbi:MAG: AsnC family transcriptional regulator [Rhizobacter sp.]|nr:AsnC family transcriptional regulator [Rhizobacter sp.]